MVALGKKPAVPDHRDLLLKSYVTPAALPKPPRSFGAERAVHSWGMLGNDRVGDCVFAGAAHEQMVFSGGKVRFDEGVVLGDYSAVTGYNGTPDTDVGTDVRDAMKYRRSAGIMDSYGKRHRIAAYAAIEPRDWTTLLTALWLFDAVGIGIEVPEYLVAGEPPSTWRVNTGGSQQIVGGHYIPLVARRGTLRLVSWGRTYNVTKEFLDRYCDEAWVPFSEEMLDSGGHSPEGFDRAQLLRDLAAL